jgi:hypothetical protein
MAAGIRPTASRKGDRSRGCFQAIGNVTAKCNAPLPSSQPRWLFVRRAWCYRSSLAYSLHFRGNDFYTRPCCSKRLADSLNIGASPPFFLQVFTIRTPHCDSVLLSPLHGFTRLLLNWFNSITDAAHIYIYECYSSRRGTGLGPAEENSDVSLHYPLPKDAHPGSCSSFSEPLTQVGT